MQQDRIAVVTGATTGIGFATACGLAEQGFRLIALGRDRERIATAKAALAERGADADWIEADFSSLADVRRAASDIAGLTDRVDVLINNAGALFDGRYMTVDGFERTFALNHLASFLLTVLLLPQLAAAGRMRVEGVAGAHRAGGRIADERGRRHVRLAVTELERPGHALGDGGNLDQRRFRDVQDLVAKVHERR